MNVNPEDDVTEGQDLGVCGSTGMTDITRLGMLLYGENLKEEKYAEDESQQELKSYGY